MTDHDFLTEALQKADLILSGFELFFFQGTSYKQVFKRGRV